MTASGGSLERGEVADVVPDFPFTFTGFPETGFRIQPPVSVTGALGGRTSDDRQWRESSSEVRSSERELAPRCGATTIELADGFSQDNLNTGTICEQAKNSENHDINSNEASQSQMNNPRPLGPEIENYEFRPRVSPHGRIPSG